MPLSGGTFTRNYDWTDDRDGAVKIQAERFDVEMDDIAAALSKAMYNDGQQTATADQPMGGFHFTDVGDGTAATDSVSLGQVQAQGYIWCGTAGGTADALTLTPSPAITAYAAGQSFRFIAASNNTGAATVAISGLSTRAIQNYGAALLADQIVSGKMYEIADDGTQVQLQHVVAVPPAPASTVTDNRLARFDGTTGRLQNTGWSIDDSDNLSGSANQLINVRLKRAYDHSGGTISSSSGTLTVDASAGAFYETTLTENVTTLTVSNLASNGVLSITLKINQDASSAYTIAWGSWDFGDEGAPDISALSSEHWVVLWTEDGGTTKRAARTWKKTS